MKSNSNGIQGKKGLQPYLAGVVKSESIKFSAVLDPVQSEAPSVLSESGYLRLSQIIGDKTMVPPRPPLVPASASSVWSWVKANRFPAPLKIGLRTTVWRVSDVRAWLEGSWTPSQTGGKESG